MQPSIEVLREKKLPKLDEHLHFPSATTQVMDKAEMMKETEAVKDNSVTATDGICTASILKNSSHRDGAIYKGNWEECYLIDIADRKESKGSKYLSCSYSLFLGHLQTMSSIDMYGFVYGRWIRPLGSLIEMSGPKRGIPMLSDVLTEFDMRIKNGEKEEDDLQLIDGLIHYDERMWWCPFTAY
ncbi:uncharacterized protein [Setaria viridis]|uniref:uncharacterized protein n=1 Tax=Setaria viridis TaxID=4556 RepID=UPI003B3BA829